MSVAGTSLDTGSVLADRWVLARRIGAGASSNVYAARDLRLDRWVAIKALHQSLATDPGFLDSFRKEANLASSLSVNVVPFYDFGTHDLDGVGIPFMVTALMSGGSLRAMLDAGRRLDVAQAVFVGREAARGLSGAHDLDLVHSDVKPANLLFDDKGNPALSDFGVARMIATAASTEPLGPASATTRYASPEQVQGRPLTGRSDVYSLALVLIESVTGVVPLLADTIAGTIALRSEGSIDVSVDFGVLREPLFAATASDPGQRCGSAELLGMLASAAERIGEPRPLDLVRLDDPDDQTSEIPVERNAAGVVLLGPVVDTGPGSAPVRGEPGAGERDSAPGGVAEDLDDELIDLTDGVVTADDTAADDTAGDAALGPADDGAADLWGSDSIAAADEYARLAESRPTNPGPVEPLDLSDAPGAIGENATQDAKHSSARSRQAGGWRLALLVVLVLLLLGSAGWAVWWFQIRVPTHEVPELVGSDVATATAVADENSWAADLGRTRVDGTVAGEVVEQDPAPGTELAEGETLRLTVSDGPTLVVLPQIAGLPEPDAIAALEANELTVGERGSQYNEDAAAGIVLLFAPAGGLEPDEQGQIPKGTAVDMVVSDGPAPRVVPAGLVGSSRSAAEAALAAVQLSADVSTDYSDTVAEGVVISAGIEAGAEVPRNSAVPLVVSDGPRPIVVPDVTGQSGSSAAAALEDAGFTVSGIEGSPTGTVLATDPVAGESRPPGSAVRIFTRQ